MANKQPQSFFFGRKKGRPLNLARQAAFDERLPVYAIEEETLSLDYTLDPKTLFAKPVTDIVFEVGFGNGERLSADLQHNPDTSFLGAEPFINGMAAFLKSLPENNPGNIRVINDDALILARSLKKASLDRIYILNPDPWHKARHHKRRIINPDSLSVFADILKPGGTLLMTSDVPDMAQWMFDHAQDHDAFAITKETQENRHTPPDNWIPTRYETKKAKGHMQMAYLTFVRK